MMEVQYRIISARSDNHVRPKNQYIHFGSQKAIQRFWLGIYPGMSEEMIDFMIQKIREFVRAEGES
ncbi:MAG: hypothetical protein K8R75_08400 [Deltaproteobacteria bacterium]|nr:hypothetical protein [Deltaproteobacteria bacterium]